MAAQVVNNAVATEAAEKAKLLKDEAFVKLTADLATAKQAFAEADVSKKPELLNHVNSIQDDIESREHLVQFPYLERYRDMKFSTHWVHDLFQRHFMQRRLVTAAADKKRPNSAEVDARMAEIRMKIATVDHSSQIQRCFVSMVDQL